MNSILNYLKKDAKKRPNEETIEQHSSKIRIVENTQHESSTSSLSITTNYSDYPIIWNQDQWTEKVEKYPWLVCRNKKIGCGVCTEIHHLRGLNLGKGVQISKEWASCKIGCGNAESKSTQLSAFRNKIKRHLESNAHIIATKIIEERKKHMIEESLNNVQINIDNATKNVFRTAYYLAKHNRPFMDHSDLINLQQLNGVKMGCSLHSRFSAVNIISHVAQEMRRKIIKNIVNHSSKLSVLIDESTTNSVQSAMVIFIKASVNNAPPMYIFLDLIELTIQNGETIANELIAALHKYGLNEEYLQKNWISFVSDGASLMLGKHKGVATILKRKYPLLFNWHCLNHRLELAVIDVIKQQSSVNHFKSFMDSLYALYNQSTKNKSELKKACQILSCQFLKIGRVLDIRWVSSSFRSVEAIWKSFPALCKHFKEASEDSSRDAKTKSKFMGLYKKLTSVEFLKDLALLADVLQELSSLSLELQDRKITLWQADLKIKRTIRILESYIEYPGEYLIQLKNIEVDMTFKDTNLKNNSKHVQIKKTDFLRNIITSMKQRLVEVENQQLICDLKVFDSDALSENKSDIRFGKSEVRQLAQKFNLNVNNAVRGMRDYVEYNTISQNFEEIYNCVLTLPCSTAECERGFSLMNLICTDIRSSLLIQNISNLMFINLNGPLINNWNPDDYVKSWMLNHRSATDNQTKKTDLQKNHIEDNVDRQHLWSLL